MDFREQHKKTQMDEKKRKEIEAKLLKLFTQTGSEAQRNKNGQAGSPAIKVIRRRKGKPDIKVA